MGYILDSILKRIVFQGPETINADWTSEPIDLEDREGEFSIQADYDGGISPELTFSLEVTNTPEVEGSWAPYEDSAQEVLDADATILYDIEGTGVSYMRVKIVVAAGSFDLQQILFTGKRRH